MADPIQHQQATPRLALPPGHVYPWYVRLILAHPRPGARLADQLVRVLRRSERRGGARARGRAREARRARAARSLAIYTEREKAALAFAEALTDPARRVDDARFARLRAHFDEQAVLEISALAAFQNLSSKFNAALGLPTQGFCARAG